MIKAARLPATIRERLARLPERVGPVPGLAALWLFGSYARGDETPLSDVDLAYLPEASPGPSFDVDLFQRVAAALGTDEVTLVNLEEAPPVLALRVLRDGRLLLGPSPGAVAIVTERVLGRHPDSRRLLDDALRGEQGGAMEIDRDKVLAQLRLLEGDLRRLREKARLGEAAYLEDLDAQDVVMRRVQTAVEACANVGNHLIARLQLALAEDYASVFRVLGDAGILDRDLAARMAELARFRNLLVHLYWRVDHRQVHRRLEERIGLLEGFREQVTRFLASR